MNSPQNNDNQQQHSKPNEDTVENYKEVTNFIGDKIKDSNSPLAQELKQKATLYYSNQKQINQQMLNENSFYNFLKLSQNIVSFCKEKCEESINIESNKILSSCLKDCTDKYLNQINLVHKNIDNINKLNINQIYFYSPNNVDNINKYFKAGI